MAAIGAGARCVQVTRRHDPINSEQRRQRMTVATELESIFCRAAALDFATAPIVNVRSFSPTRHGWEAAVAAATANDIPVLERQLDALELEDSRRRSFNDQLALDAADRDRDDASTAVF